jgi:hypothetical protein
MSYNLSYGGSCYFLAKNNNKSALSFTNFRFFRLKILFSQQFSKSYMQFLTRCFYLWRRIFNRKITNQIVAFWRVFVGITVFNIQRVLLFQKNKICNIKV